MIDERYRIELCPCLRYLASTEMKLKTMLTCAILDRAGITITEDLVTNLGVEEYANELQDGTLTFSESEKIWKTIHSNGI